MFLAYVVLLKVFLTEFYFINSLFKRKSLLKLTQESINISQVSYFSFSFKLTEKKTVPLKNMVGERRVTKNFLILEIFQKGEGLDKKGVEKNKKGVKSLKETMS